MSEWTAKIAENFEYAGASIVWMRDDGGQRTVTNGTVAWVASPGAQADVEPMRLSDDLLRALHIALLRYYDGADDARMLRKDYDAERARVDRLIEYATNSVRQQPKASS